MEITCLPVERNWVHGQSVSIWMTMICVCPFQEKKLKNKTCIYWGKDRTVSHSVEVCQKIIATVGSLLLPCGFQWSNRGYWVLLKMTSPTESSQQTSKFSLYQFVWICYLCVHACIEMYICINVETYVHIKEMRISYLLFFLTFYYDSLSSWTKKLKRLYNEHP